MNEQVQDSTQRRTLSPLWVIALFISLTETVITVGVLHTSDGVQLALTIFVLLFPLLIAGLFFFILWNKSWVLYSPAEYGTGTEVKDYVREMSSNKKSLDELQLYPQIQQSIREALTSQQVVMELSKLIVREGDTAQETVTNILSDAATNAEEKILSHAFLTIDTRTFSTKGHVWQVPYDYYDSISVLLNDIYFTLKPGVPPATYGITWLLRDRANGQVFKDMGLRYAKKHGKVMDDRTLKAVGIKPGTTLEIFALE